MADQERPSYFVLDAWGRVWKAEEWAKGDESSDDAADHS